MSCFVCLLLNMLSCFVCHPLNMLNCCFVCLLLNMLSYFVCLLLNMYRCYLVFLLLGLHRSRNPRDDVLDMRFIIFYLALFLLHNRKILCWLELFIRRNLDEDGLYLFFEVIFKHQIRRYF
jgi:hypothetical protein